MSTALDLSHIYNLRNKFTIIGLTGQIGSGCSEVAEQLVKGFSDGKDFENPFDSKGYCEAKNQFIHNSYRKYRHVYNYAKINFKSYYKIDYKNVIIIFVLQNGYDNLINFLQSSNLSNELKLITSDIDFTSEIKDLEYIKERFEELSGKFSTIDVSNLKSNNNWEELFRFFFKSDFNIFCSDFLSLFKKRSLLKRNKLLQLISSNLRKSGSPYNFTEISADKVFTIVELINLLIKCLRTEARTLSEAQTQVVIDDLRNPIEIMFFKQRYAAFYTIAVNRDDEKRRNQLISKYTNDPLRERESFWHEEYKGGKDYEFYKPNISSCIQQADIHITFITNEEADELNTKTGKNGPNDHTSPYFNWKMQLLKYVSLISHPGLITPSPEERCMQLAYTAKHNSGCISRHIGAAITDENYSIKAIGWNNTPDGHVPCVLRTTEDLLKLNKDCASFTVYEKTNVQFNSSLRTNFENQIEEHKDNLKGRNVCFCFKDIKNSFSDGKNQVHTRSLHAEESAFLQVTKYGGTGIQNGKLFTTASPCELCAKKAYQLGIKVIYYIDPYPGISFEHILKTGNKEIDIRLFNGAIGNAYHWLYDPVMPYKDELTLLLGNKFDDFATTQKKLADDLKRENLELKSQVENLKKRISN